jgi:hypothetical protein
LIWFDLICFHQKGNLFCNELASSLVNTCFDPLRNCRLDRTSFTYMYKLSLIILCSFNSTFQYNN